MDRIASLLADFSAVSLTELDRAALQNRVESKFLFPEPLLPEVLAALHEHYRVLDIDGCRQFPYLTWYFDTPDFRLYRDHHNGYARRMKVRQRRYEQSGLTYFEVKRKDAEWRTDKSRIPIEGLQPELLPQMQDLVGLKRLDPASLEYKLSNRFRRITLCNAVFTERVTLDTDISMERGSIVHSAGPVVLMELKQSRPDWQSPALLQMKKAHIFESGFSKYAVAAARLYPELKHNNLKPVFLKLRQYASA